MKAAKTTSPSASKNTKKVSLSEFFSRYHSLIFFLIVIGGLVTAVYLLSNIIALSDATNENYTPQTTSTTFDTETIEKVRQLTPSSSTPPALKIPSGRIDPFPQ